MHRIILGIVTSLVVIAAACWGSGRPEDLREKTDYGSFSSLSIAIPADIIIEQEESCRVEADIPGNLSRNLIIRNDRGTLKIEPGRPGWRPLRSDSIRFIISMPQLEKLTVRGSGRIRSNDTWTNSRTEVLTTGSSDIEIEGFNASELGFTTSGSGDIRLGSAKGESLTVETTGSGDILIDTAQAYSAGLITTGSGDIHINIKTETLKSLQTGSGDIRLTGRAEQTEIQTNGSGDMQGSGFSAGLTNIIISGSGDVTLTEGSRLKNISITGSGRFQQMGF